MKKVLLIMIAVIGLGFAANAQSNAIGVRLGGGQGFGAELSYQKGLGGINRLEADLGYRSYAHSSWMSLTALYQAHFDINAIPNLGWYAGVGPRIDLYTGGGDAALALGICGQAGLDYQFNALPVQLSLDIRPCFTVYPATSFYWGDIALGIRYTF